MSVVHRLVAVVRADLLIRLRKLSTAVVFVLLSAVAFFWVPDPETGRALLNINGQRALYNSAAIGMATAMLASLFVGLFGFYVISNALRRDASSRCGFVIASTRVGSLEYLAGKFLGNMAFLTLFISGFMLVSMAMVLVRGEAPLEVIVFVKQYLLLVPPTIVLVSALAILFESAPFLSGRFGDIAYFFLWLFLLSAVSISSDKEGGEWLRYFDFFGFAFLTEQVKTAAGTSNVAIGASEFDAAKGAFLFKGLEVGSWLAARVTATFSPLLLLLVARGLFHRFDPVKVKGGAASKRRSLFARINDVAKKIVALVPSIRWSSRDDAEPSLFRAAVVDAKSVFDSYPVAYFAGVGVAVASAVSTRDSLFSFVLPVSIAVAGLVISDVSSRERRLGTAHLVFAAPLLKTRFVAWKLMSSLMVTAVFVAVPAVRLSMISPERLPHFLVGVLFVVAAAVSLGIVSSNAKTFTVLFLTFLYVVMSDSGSIPALDFAGVFGTATAATAAAYLGITILFLVAAQATHQWRERG